MNEHTAALTEVEAALHRALEATFGAEAEGLTLYRMQCAIRAALDEVPDARHALHLLESGAELAPASHGNARSSPDVIIQRAELARRQAAGGHLPRGCESLTDSAVPCRNSAMVWVDSPVCASHSTLRERELNRVRGSEFRGLRPSPGVRPGPADRGPIAPVTDGFLTLEELRHATF